jgi:hypothetical protein
MSDLTEEQREEQYLSKVLQNRNQRKSGVKPATFVGKPGGTVPFGGGGLEAVRAKAGLGNQSNTGPSYSSTSIKTEPQKPGAKGAFFGSLEEARAKAGISHPNSTAAVDTAYPQAPSRNDQSYNPPPPSHYNPPPASHYNPPPASHYNPPASSYNPPPVSHYNPPPQEEVIELPVPKPSHHTAVETDVSDLPLPSMTISDDRGLYGDDYAAQREAERMAKQVGVWNQGLGPQTGHSSYQTHSSHAPSSHQTHSSQQTYSSHTPVVHAVPNVAKVKQTSGTRARKDWELPPTISQHNGKFEDFLYAEICLARSSPETVLDRLRVRRQHYRGNEYVYPDFGTVLQTQEGVSGVDDAMRELSYLQPNRNKLRREEGLGMSARDFCDLARTTTQPNESADQTESRLTRYGQYSGELLQNVAFTSVPPSELILDWIIDDGNASIGRPHRKAIFNPNINVVGLASGPHSVGRIICALFSTDYKPVGEEQGHSQSNYPVQHGSTSVGSPGREYPDFKIGSLTSIENGNAALLPITQLGCDVKDLYLGIRQNGKSLEFIRTITQRGMPKKEIQTFSLPYPVTSATVTATYYPNKDNGHLDIRLGKKLASESGAMTLDFEIARFTVLGFPQSNNTRVQMEITQPDDCFIFSAGPPSKYNTDFVVVLNGNHLEFRSSFSIDEGDAVKTIHGKQAVDLPFPPTLDQIDVSGSSITIWPERRSGQTDLVPDTDVLIRVG